MRRRKHGKLKTRLLCTMLTAAMAGGGILNSISPVQAAPDHPEVWVQNSADRAFESSEKPEYAEEKMMLYAAKNEYEAAQILVRNETTLQGLYLEASDLTGENGELLSKDNIVIYREYSNEAKVPGEIELPPDGGNRYTDALLPNEKLDVEGNVTQPYWVRVYVPEGTQPGWYQGSITVHSANSSVQVPLSVKVYDVTLPKTNEANFKMLNWFGSAGCDFGALESSVPAQYGVEMYDENWWKVMESFARDLAIHRNNVIFLDVQALLMPGSTMVKEETAAAFSTVSGNDIKEESVSGK